MKVFGCVVLLSFFAFLSVSSFAQYIALPTSDTGDGKFLCIAGDRVSGGLKNQRLILWFNIPSYATGFTVAVFDGDQGGFWDITYGGANTSVWRLYADPTKSGSGGQPVDSWRSDEMIDNAWYTRAQTVSDIARSPSGNYFYRLEISWENPSASDDLNGFKVGTDVGTISTVPRTVVSRPMLWFIGATINTSSDDDGPGADPPTGYNGIWDFYVWVPAGLFEITFEEGDADWGPNGVPPDNNTKRPEFAVGDNISFTIYGPDGNQLSVSPPGSQLSEDKQYLPHFLEASTSLKPGVYRWHWEGVDMHNQVVIIPPYEIFPQPPQPPLPVAGVKIEPDLSQTAYPGQTVTLNHTISNEEIYPDVIDISVSDSLGWKINLLKPDGITLIGDTDGDGVTDTGPISANSSTGVVLKVFIPSGVTPGTSNTIVLNINSSSTSATDQAQDIITIASYQGLDIRPDNSQTAKPGEAVIYQHQIENKEAFQDTVELIPTSSQGWMVVLLDENDNPLVDTNGSGSVDTGPIPAGSTKTIKLQLSVPQSAVPGITDTITLTARSATTSLSDTVTDMTTVSEPDKPQIEVVKSVDKTTAKPGELITYTITYRNVGAATAYNLSFTDSVPQNTEFVSASGIGATITYRHAPGGQFDSSPSPPVIEVKWTIASLAPGGSGSLTIVVRVK
jgi:uncharacterized repeat protein (TIGR01451 family)